MCWTRAGDVAWFVRYRFDPLVVFEAEPFLPLARDRGDGAGGVPLC
jgi:hypothetical protein